MVRALPFIRFLSGEGLALASCEPSSGDKFVAAAVTGGRKGCLRARNLLTLTDAAKEFEAVDVPRRVCAVVRHLFSSREGASTSSSGSTSLRLFAKGAAGDEVAAAAADRAGLRLHGRTIAVRCVSASVTSVPTKPRALLPSANSTHWPTVSELRG